MEKKAHIAIAPFCLYMWYSNIRFLLALTSVFPVDLCHRLHAHKMVLIKKGLSSGNGFIWSFVMQQSQSLAHNCEIQLTAAQKTLLFNSPCSSYRSPGN